MISAFNDVEEGWSLHLKSDALEKIQRTERITRPLHEKNRRCKLQQNFVAQLSRIAATAKRIAETNQTIHPFLERHVATDPSAHAFANENDRLVRLLPRLGQRVTMGSDQSRQRIGSSPAFAHIVVVEHLDLANSFQISLPPLHPVMGRCRASAGSEQKERSRHPKRY